MTGESEPEDAADAAETGGTTVTEGGGTVVGGVGLKSGTSAGDSSVLEVATGAAAAFWLCAGAVFSASLDREGG